MNTKVTEEYLRVLGNSDARSEKVSSLNDGEWIEVIAYLYSRSLISKFDWNSDLGKMTLEVITTIGNDALAILNGE